MRKSVDFSLVSVQRNPFSDKFFTRRSLVSPEKNQDLKSDRLSTDPNDGGPRFFRLSSRNEIHDPITGSVRKYQVNRSISPLGKKNARMTEKITTGTPEPNEYYFHRQTKRNPRYHNLNPITGETSKHQITKSFVPFEYQGSWDKSEIFKPVRYVRGKGYQKSAIY